MYAFAKLYHQAMQQNDPPLSGFFVVWAFFNFNFHLLYCIFKQFLADSKLGLVLMQTDVR